MIYAITEIVLYLLIAALLGLTVGYLLWYRRAAKADAEADNMAVSLQDRTARLGLAEQDVAALIDERDRVRAESLALANSADRSAAEVESLRGHIAQIQPIADRTPELRSRLDEIEAELGEATEQTSSLRSERDRLAAATVGAVSHDESASLLAAREQAVAELETCRATVAALELRLSEARSNLDEVNAPQDEGTPAESAGVASFVGSEPIEGLRRNPDELQRISGIGPHLEKLLNENGIYAFRQIATLSSVGLRDLDAQLGFKGRIERDNWLAQASQLHSEKFGEPPQKPDPPQGPAS